MLSRNHGAVLARFCVLWMASAFAAFAQGPDSVSAGGQDTSSAGGFPTFTGILRVPHPDYRVLSLTPPGYAFKVTGMDWMSNGDLAVLTISDTVFPQSGGGFGTVYRLKGARDAVSNALPVETLYTGFKVPLGLAVAGDSVFVSDFTGLRKLVDSDGDGRIDTLQTLLAYPGESNTNTGTWNMALIHAGGRFYTSLGMLHYVDSSTNSGACKPESERGTVHVLGSDGGVRFLGSGLREANGLGLGPDGELFATNNDGEWVPTNNLVHIRDSAFYGECVGTSWDPSLVYARPAVWFPDYLQSPGQPVLMPTGRYQGQFLVGDYGAIVLSRIFLEKVGGEYQGALFPFSGGLISGATRLAVDSRGNLYLGEMEIETSEGWTFPRDPRDRPYHVGYGLEKMIPSGDSAFEMLAIRAAPNGFAIEFTRPAGPSAAVPAHFRVRQWRFQPTFHYGGPRLDLETLPVSAAALSPDGKTAVLEIPGLKPDRMVQIQLHRDFRSRDGKAPWAYEAWYTLNAIPEGGNPVRSSNPSNPPSAYEVRRSAGGPEVRVILRESYTLEIRNLRGERILAAEGEGPKTFSWTGTRSQSVYSLSIHARSGVYRGLVRPF